MKTDPREGSQIRAGRAGRRRRARQNRERSGRSCRFAHASWPTASLRPARPLTSRALWPTPRRPRSPALEERLEKLEVAFATSKAV